MPSPRANLTRRKRVSPTKTIGASGTPIFGGYVQQEFGERQRTNYDRNRTYREILRDVSIVAAGVRYFLNLTAKQAWAFEPSESDPDAFYADAAEQFLMHDPDTPWHRIVMRVAMYRFMGFSVQEWTAKKTENGVITFADIEPRAQHTIERWDVDEGGHVTGIIQRAPQDSREIYLPRGKCLYAVDNALTDSPEGYGIFRHLINPARRLLRYEQLEMVGFETDLRGIPVIKMPLVELEAKGKDKLEEAERIFKKFIQNHVRSTSSGLIVDSQTYTTTDDATRPSSVPKWDISLLSSSGSSLPQLYMTIARINKEIARIMGVEQMLLGEDKGGSYALSKDKTSSFFLLIDGTLREIARIVEQDLLRPIWALNGWDEETIPIISVESLRFQDVEQVAMTLRDMAAAGAVLAPDDPAVGEVRDLLGLSKPDETTQAIDAALGSDDDDDDDEEEIENANAS